MSGGIYCEFKVGAAGAGSANAHYITRSAATGKDDNAVYTQHYPEHARAGQSYEERRRNIVEYNRQKEEDELSRRRRGGGETRTHYRCKLSFETKISTEQAREMAKEYLTKNFPLSRAVAVVHQDTDHTHVHINIQARGIDTKKLRLSEQQFRNLDSAWGSIYGKAFGQEKVREHELKKAETRAWKKEYALAKAGGKEVSRAAPERADKMLSKGEYTHREARNYGADKTRGGRDQRGVASRGEAVGGGERAADGYAGQSDRTEQAARRALQQVEGLRDRGHDDARELSDGWRGR